MVIVLGPTRPSVACHAWAASATRRAAWYDLIFKIGLLTARKFFNLTGPPNIISQNLNSYTLHTSSLSPLSSWSIPHRPPPPSVPQLRAAMVATLLTGPVLRTGAAVVGGRQEQAEANECGNVGRRGDGRRAHRWEQVRQPGAVASIECWRRTARAQRNPCFSGQPGTKMGS